VAAEALGLQSNNPSPTPIPVPKTLTNSNEGARRTLRTSIKSHSMSLSGQSTPYFTYSNIPIYDSESISWVVCPSPWTLMDDFIVVQNLWKQVQFK
jgi:hypothetical protein